MKEWADKYKGKFDDGWDKYRERVFVKAKAKGWIPQNAQLTPRPASMASWDSIPEEEKPFQRRCFQQFDFQYYEFGPYKFRYLFSKSNRWKRMYCYKFCLS